MCNCIICKACLHYDKTVNLIEFTCSVLHCCSTNALSIGHETKSEKLIGLSIEAGQDITIGQDFEVKVSVTNKSSSDKTLKIHVHGSAVLSNGAPGQTIKSCDYTVTLKKWESKNALLQV